MNIIPIKFFFLSLILIFNLSLKSQTDGKILDKTIAVVGGEMLLFSTLESQIVSLKSQGVIVDDNNKCEIMEELLFQKLLVHQAKQDSIVVSDAEVEMEIDRRLNYFIAQIGSERKLEQYYKKTIQEIKEEFRATVKDQMISQRMQGRITSGLTITPKEVKEFFKKIPEDSIPLIESEVKYAQILIYAKESEEEINAAKERIQTIRDRIIKGENFGTLAILYSEDEGSAKNGGEIGFLGRAELVPEYSATAFKLKNSAVSEIVKTKFGFHIIQLIERRGQKVNTRHILIKIKVSEKEVQKAKNLADSIYNMLPKDTLTFGEYALKYSNDEASAKSDGVVANPQTGTAFFSLDEVEPQVYYTLEKLNEGEISKPVPAQSIDGKKGYRIIQVISKTEPHKASLETDYSKIQQAALAAKEGEHTLKWIKEKLTDTYVNISDEYKSCSFENPWVR
ncbi:MAG: peptidylprolyl isomerase [Vicingaceae bacterium]|nr:peptidylprolyl isomerase [Vicingaceae bacterium]